MHTQGTDIFLPESGLVLTAILLSSAHIHHSTSLLQVHQAVFEKSITALQVKEIHMTIL